MIKMIIIITILIVIIIAIIIIKIIIITDSPNKFPKVTVMEIDVSDSHKLIATMMMIHSPKQIPDIVTYRKQKFILPNTNLSMKRL